MHGLWGFSPGMGEFSELCVPVLQDRYCHPSRCDISSSVPGKVSVLRAGHVKQDTLSFVSSELIYSVFICLSYTTLTLLKSQCLAFIKVLPHFCRYSCSFQILEQPSILEQMLLQRRCQWYAMRCHGLLVTHFFLQGWLSCQISVSIRLIWILNFDHLTSEHRTVFLNLVNYVKERTVEWH